MLLPAMGCDGQLWARQIMDLADLATPEFGDLSQDDSLAATATRVLAEAPPRFAVAGVSLSGYVAMEMVRQAPDRVERVALFGTRASMDNRPRTIADQGLLATAPHADPRLSGDVSGPAQAMIERVGPVVFEHQQCALLARSDINAAIDAVRVPTLVAVGDRDRICTPDDARALPHPAVVRASRGARTVGRGDDAAARVARHHLSRRQGYGAFASGWAAGSAGAIARASLAPLMRP